MLQMFQEHLPEVSSKSHEGAHSEVFFILIKTLSRTLKLIRATLDVDSPVHIRNRSKELKACMLVYRQAYGDSRCSMSADPASVSDH